ncbi:sensor histidine kinase [Pseudonocardia benzenivorans]|uniref:histidine kinase n=1 Tax=Pseudonocardia benzenivorans TaxID=228005 RepID=A0ABW3VIB5_9PSEU
MIAEPAHRTDGAPQAGAEVGARSEGARPGSPTVRLLPPGPDDRLRFRRARWQSRQRLERQLHDGASLRISALALKLGVVRHHIASAAPDLDGSIDDLQDQLHAVLQELREIAGRIYPTLLDEAGLGPALRGAGDRCEATVRVQAPDRRFDPAAEGAAYFAVADLLGALGPDSDVAIVVGDDGGALVVTVEGVPVEYAGRMLDEVAGLDGTIDVTGGTGVGTITARIPCA